MKLGNTGGITGIVAVNGMMIDLSGNAPTVAEYIDTGRTYLDGSVQIGAFDGIVRNRIRMALNGQMVVTLIIDENDEPLGEPWVETNGLPEVGSSGAALVEVVEEDLTQFVMRASPKTLRDDDKLEKELKSIARRTSQDEIGKKPEVMVIISRMG